MTKVLLLTNILTPYRRNFYDALYNELSDRDIDFQVLLMAKTEPERKWDYDEFRTKYSKLLPHRTVSFNNRFIHLNFGYSKILKKINPDIVIASGSYVFPSVWTTIRLKDKLEYELLFWSESHLHEIRSYSNLLLKIREKMRRKIYSQFDGFWYAGKLSKMFIEKYSKQNSSYVFVPNLISEGAFYEANSLRINKTDLRNKWGLQEDKFVFICPARLTKVKGIIPFLRLLIKSKNKDNITVLIPGDGELKKDINDFALDNNIDVRLTGYKLEEEIIEFYALADSFLMPSLSDPNPLTSIEAIWAGLPLLVSEHVGNHPEIVNVGKNGFVFKYTNTEKAVSLIDKIVSSSESWKQNASKISLKIAKENYDTRIAVKRIVNSMIRN